MGNMNFEEAMFIKNIQSELNYLHGMNTIKYNTRRLRALIYAETGLREFVTCLKFAYSTFSKELGEIIDEFREYYKIPESENMKQVFVKMLDKINEFSHEMFPDDTAPDKRYVVSNVIDDIIELTKNFIKQCDRINEFTQLAYRVAVTDETKYNKTTPNDIVKFESAYIGNIDGIKTLDEDLKTSNVDRNSQEFGKIVCKRCKMIKNEVISLVNKYFGKNSKYSDFNIIQQIL